MTNQSKVLLLGYSDFAKKAVIPSLRNNSGLELVGIASKTRYQEIPSDVKKFDDYNEAIRNSDCNTVYISTHNSAHYEWIICSLNNGKNVICDKPVVLNIKQAQDCFDLAQKNKLVIFESIPYLFHKQHQTISKLISKSKAPLQKITISFGFRISDQKNFRKSRELGGGCIYDLGPYLVSTGRYYFKKNAESVSCLSHLDEKNGLPLSSSIVIKYGDNEILHGFIGFEMEYRNHLELWSENLLITLDRAFTIPIDLSNTLFCKSYDKIKEISIPKFNHFLEMFNIYNNLPSSNYSAINKEFYERSITLEAISNFANTGVMQTI